MIQITAYLRDDEDLAKWKAIENKTNWIHVHLNNEEYSGNITKKSLTKIKADVDKFVPVGTFEFPEPTPASNPGMEPQRKKPIKQPPKLNEKWEGPLFRDKGKL